jgi:hypothetical protein
VELKLPCPFSHVSSSRQHQAEEELMTKRLHIFIKRRRRRSLKETIFSSLIID